MADQFILPPDFRPAEAYNRICWTEGTWRQIDVDQPSVLRSIATVPGVLYARDKEPSSRSYADQEYLPGEAGFIVLPRAGRWWVYCSIGGTSAIEQCCILIPIWALDIASIIRSIAGAAQRVDLYKVGGTLQTGVDLAGAFAARTLQGGASNATIAATEAEVTGLAADPTRKFLYIQNTSTGGQYISISFGTEAAVLWDGITLKAGSSPDYCGEWISFSAQDDRVTEAVRAIASAAGGRLSIQKGI